MAMPNVQETIKQLNAARNLALADSTLYPQIVPGLLRIIGADAILELRRWGADFFAETFASPVLAQEHKQNLSLIVLDTLKGFLDKTNEDAAVIRAVVQTAASIYPYVFRHIISNPNDATSWQKMSAIKSTILRRMDSAPAGVRICCVKFLSKVVQVQTPGLIADPRRQDQNEISLALVPREHPIVTPSNLEAEASGLLDRLLGVLQDNSGDALLVTATLNSLGSLVKSRASIANKIVATILNFNPLTLANTSPISAKNKVMVKSMARTTMAFLINIVKKNPNHPLASRITQYVDRLRHSLVEAFDESSRKRAAPAEPTDGLSDAKRQRLDASITANGQAQQPPPLGPGPVSYAQLFTLTSEQGLTSFDVNVIPLHIVQSIVVPLLSSIDKGRMDNAINSVRARYLSLSKKQPNDALHAVQTATGTAPPAPDDDDDYEPDAPGESTEQILNELDQEASDETNDQAQDIALATFNLPPPPPLTDEETTEFSKDAVTRIFGTLNTLDQTIATKPQKLGFNRLAASNNDRDSWITIISRIATRAPAGLEDGIIKSEQESRHPARRQFSPSDAIREALYLYVIDDFRTRIGIAISWLNEEWYNDRIKAQQMEGIEAVAQNYEKWMLKVLDGIIPFLDPESRLIIRFLSEVPSLNRDVLQRVVRIAKDPQRIKMAVQAVHFLILLKPPVREISVDAMTELYQNYEDARPMASKVLAKFRPAALQQNEENAVAA